ncbi:hypothetical protein [Agaribacterium sp. ZY112]|uniref:hypothetical protein n=1 Tax=Agaribacterium sp. ZY112 TaxID=3233574 RepID=UPI0035236D1E
MRFSLSLSLKFILSTVLIYPFSASCSPFYFGGSFGKNQVRETVSVSDLGYSSPSQPTLESSDTQDLAYSLYAGYSFDFSSYTLSAESGYMILGKSSTISESKNVTSQNGDKENVRVSADTDALTLSLVALKKIKGDFRAFTRIGAGAWETSSRLSTNIEQESNQASFSNSGIDPYWGLGIEYKFLRIGFDRYDFDNYKTDYMYFGFKF